MAEPAAELTVKHFRLALLWPLRLLTGAGALGPQQRPWQVLRDMGEALKRLSDLLDAVSDERLSGWTKVKALAAVWRRGAD